MTAQISDRRLTTTEVHWLERGLNFNTSDATVVDFVAALEPVIYNPPTKQGDKERFQAQLTTTLGNQKHKLFITTNES